MDNRDPRSVDLSNPHPGYYIVSITPKGWAVPVRLSIVNEFVQLIVNGQQVPDTWAIGNLPDEAIAATADGRLFEHPLFRIMLFGKRCDEATYHYRLAVAAWAVDNAPWHPSLHPEWPIDLCQIPATEF
jgi:hypothetical protein